MDKKISKKEIRKDLGNIAALEAVANSEGGKILRKLCAQDVTSSIDTICGGFTNLTHTELIAHCARLKERLDMYRVITNVKRNKDVVLEALEAALEEDPD